MRTAETLKLTLGEGYLIPILEKLHRTSPLAKVDYKLSPHSITIYVDEVKTTGKLQMKHLIPRVFPILEEYVQEFTAPDGGCLMCGSDHDEMCAPDCRRLEADLILKSMRALR